MFDLARKKFIAFLMPKIVQKNRFGIVKHGLMMVFTLLKNLL